MSGTQQLPGLKVGEEPNGIFDFTGKLNDGETITGTPLVEEQTTTDLTISNIIVNTTVVVDVNGVDVAIGKAVLFHMVDQVVANSPYKLKATINTSDSPSAKRILCGEFTVEDC